MVAAMQIKQANPEAWGAWAAIGGGTIAAIAEAVGEPLGGTVFGYAMGAFFWVWAVAHIRNWLANRPA